MSKPLYWESGLEIQTVYGPEDVDASGGWDGIGEPGQPPYTRGVHPEMYRSRPWTTRPEGPNRGPHRHRSGGYECVPG